MCAQAEDHTIASRERKRSGKVFTFETACETVLNNHRAADEVVAYIPHYSIQIEFYRVHREYKIIPERHSP